LLPALSTVKTEAAGQFETSIDLY